MNENFLSFIETSLQQLQIHKQIATECGVNDVMIKLHDVFIVYCEQIKERTKNTKLADNYINLFQNDINQTLVYLPYREQQNSLFIQPQNKEQIKNDIENFQEQFSNQVQKIQFNLYIFNKLSFFDKNIVAIGANGSGKTTLSNHLKNYLPKTGAVIAAQKVLIIPTFSSISNYNQTSQKLQQSQTADKSLKTTYSTENNGNAYSLLVQLGGEFQILLDNLLAERNSVRNKFCDALKNGDSSTIVPPETKLDITLNI